jgi:hypothetical protein
VLFSPRILSISSPLLSCDAIQIPLFSFFFFKKTIPLRRYCMWQIFVRREIFARRTIRKKRPEKQATSGSHAQCSLRLWSAYGTSSGSAMPGWLRAAVVLLVVVVVLVTCMLCLLLLLTTELIPPPPRICTASARTCREIQASERQRERSKGRPGHC